jgi:hypothetical protein
MESLATGFLSSGLQPNDRILICGYNSHSVLIAALAASRAGLVFSLASPNFTDSEQLKHLIITGGFRCVLLYAPGEGGSDYTNNMLLEICPELKRSQRGKLKSVDLPTLTHVILGNEEHKHAGTYTLSDIFAKCNKQRMEKLPNYRAWNSHRMAAIAWTLVRTNFHLFLRSPRSLIFCSAIKCEFKLFQFLRICRFLRQLKSVGKSRMSFYEPIKHFREPLVPRKLWL